MRDFFLAGSFLFLLSLCLSAPLWQLYRWHILSNPSSQIVLDLVANDLDRYLDPSLATLLDLGSGFGTSLWFFHHRGWLHLQGIEGFTPVWLIASLFHSLYNSPFEILKGDYREKEISATVLFVYLSREAMEQMVPWIERRSVHFQWLVSHTFVLPGYRPHHTLHATDLYNTPIYIYNQSQMFGQPKA